MKCVLHRRVIVLGLMLLLSRVGAAQEIVVTPEKAQGIYDIAEKIVWHVSWKGNDLGDGTGVKYALKKGGLTTIKSGTLDLSNGPATVETALDQPGTILAEFRCNVGKKEIKTLAGAAIAPEKIAPSAPRPADFDEFWNSKIQELSKIPENPQLEPGDSGKPSVDYFKIRMDNINSSHIYGQLARPKNGEKFPAILIVQYAGVYGLPKSNVINQADHGWLALNIMAHDLPFDQPEAFYKNAAATTLKDYIAIGNDDREKSYFLRMYLGCYRAAQYLSERPDWDGKTLVVMGTSQGGQQSIVTAALCPKITALMANVPAGADVTGPRVGRAAGFPYWSNYAKSKKDEKIVETGRYFDTVNFASRIKCPALVALGLIDETCPPAGVYAMCNQLTGPREILAMVHSDHHGTHNAQAAFYQRSGTWNKALLQGQPVPPGK